MQSDGLMLFSYDPKSQQMKNLGFCKSTGFPYADNYVENLVLLDKPKDLVSKEESEQEEEVQVKRLDSSIQLKISAFTFLSSILFLVYTRYFCIAISKY